MKYLALLILSLLAPYFLFPAANEHHLSLKEETITIQNFGFQLVDVTNATGYKKRIGIVQKSLAYNNVPAYFVDDIDKEIQGLLLRSIEEVSGDKSLIIRVNEVQIMETYNGLREKAIAMVNLSFVFKEGEKYIEKFTAGMTAVKTSGSGVTKKQPLLIAQAIGMCFDAFYKRAQEGKLINAEINLEDLYKKPETDEAMIAEFMNADRSKKGIYKTFFDFKANTPDLETEFDVDYKTKKSEDESIVIKFAQITDIKTGDEITEAWGFTDGRIAYTLIGNKYLPLLKDEDGYYLELKVRDAENMHAAGIAGGLIGTAIAHAASPVLKVKLDYFTGEFDYTDQSENENQKLEKEFAIKFFGSAYNHPDSRLEVYVNGAKICTLRKETWYEYEIMQPGDTLTVSVVSTNGMKTIQKIIPKTSNQDVYLCIDKKKKAPQVNKVMSNKIQGINSLMTPNNKIETEAIN